LERMETPCKIRHLRLCGIKAWDAARITVNA
jgi:hypothetical protein